ncbi:MAG TPA: hypothetical protein VF510_20530 [Ktedonobacterales bacterium]
MVTETTQPYTNDTHDAYADPSLAHTASTPPAATQPAAVAAPRRPALAPDVQLLGVLPSTGFKDRQWLVQRGNRFIQITEVLYRTLEQVDGNNDLDQIAAGVCVAIDRTVTPEQIAQLVHTRLIPLRLVAPVGMPTSADKPPSMAMPPSALQLNLRLKVLGPQYIEPITRVLQILFAPPLLFPLLVAAVAAQWWLYSVHGLVRALQETIFTPALLLIILAIALLSTIFHEFGHASALHYGGGRVRSMGVGIYLIYPALYTDVTDSYRLSRAAKVRTDLGGVYFHMLFALAIIVISKVTHIEFLLVTVLLIDFAIISQLTPIVRMDGYWMLCDLAGVPDFFSQAAPFLRSLTPGARVQGTRLPTLKWWVKITFVLFLLLTFPMLLMLWVLMAVGIPALLTNTWVAFVHQRTLFTLAQSHHDLPSMALAIIQLILLLIPVVGSLYMLYAVGRKPASGLWKWSQPTLLRRLIGGLIAACIIAALLWAGLPSAPQQQVASELIGVGVVTVSLWLMLPRLLRHKITRSLTSNQPDV